MDDLKHKKNRIDLFSMVQYIYFMIYLKRTESLMFFSFQFIKLNCFKVILLCSICITIIYLRTDKHPFIYTG